MAKNSGKCSECSKSLRTAIEQFIGPAKSKPIGPGTTMPGGTTTCIKQLSGTSWCADFRIGLWVVRNGRKVCSACAEKRIPAPPPRYAFNPDSAGPGIVILTLDDIKVWRKTEYDAGRPSELADFFKAFNICPTCKGTLKSTFGWRGSTPILEPCRTCNGSGLDHPAPALEPLWETELQPA